MLKIFVLLFCSFTVNYAYAEAEPNEELDTVRQEIDFINKQRELNKQSKENLYAQLREQSLIVSTLNRDLHNTEKKITAQNETLSALRLKQGDQQVAQQQQLDALYVQLRSAYINSQPSYLKILLNQQDPTLLSRNNIYYRYFHQARQSQLAKIDNLLNNLSAEQKAVFAAQNELQLLLLSQQQQKQSLTAETAERQQTLAALDQKIASQDAQLANLKKQEDELQDLINSLEKKAAARSARETKQKPFPAFTGQTGELLWPLKGKLVANYGEPRNLGKLRWKGIMIASDMGHSVLASAAGRVVFADWMRGFGLLIIVDHGNQIMTLYGNNESLIKSVGDPVKAGEVIAQSGNQGVRQLAGLYFEVRHKGSPTDPLKWLQKQS